MKGNYRSHLWLLALVVILGLARLCVREIPLDRVGVKQNLLGKGVIEEDYLPGYCLVIPGLQRLFLMDPTIQDYTMAPEVGIPTERSLFSGPQLHFARGEPIDLRTQDEFTVAIDITVLYRIRPGAAHQVLVEIGSGHRFHGILEQQARKIIWEVLAKLSCPDFYNAEKRAAQAELTRDELNRALAGYHLEVLAVLIRDITYQEEFEQKLLAKQLIDQGQLLAKAQEQVEQAKERTQMIEKQTSATVLAIEAELEKERKTLIAKTDAEIAQIEADANFEAQKVIAEAESYKRQQTAAGELAKTTATAVGDKAIAAAYEGSGGELYLAKQVLENIEIGDIELNTNVTNPFDVEQMLELIGLDLEALKKAR